MKFPIALLSTAVFSLSLMAGCNPTGETADNSNNSNGGSSSGEKTFHKHVHGPHGGEVREIPDCEHTLECVTKPDQELCEFYGHNNLNLTREHVRVVLATPWRFPSSAGMCVGP